MLCIKLLDTIHHKCPKHSLGTCSSPTHSLYLEANESSLQLNAYPSSPLYENVYTNTTKEN